MHGYCKHHKHCDPLHCEKLSFDFHQTSGISFSNFTHHGIFDANRFVLFVTKQKGIAINEIRERYGDIGVRIIYRLIQPHTTETLLRMGVEPNISTLRG
jgi:hypothetical protein